MEKPPEIIFRIRILEKDGEVLVEKSGDPNRPYRPTIIFTGFKAADKNRLQTLAVQHKFILSKSVCGGLAFLVAGPGAGPQKLADARGERALILNEEQFLKLLASGELPYVE